MSDAIQHIHQADPETLLAWMEELSEPDRRAVIHVRLSRDLLWFGSQV